MLFGARVCSFACQLMHSSGFSTLLNLLEQFLKPSWQTLVWPRSGSPGTICEESLEALSLFVILQPGSGEMCDPSCHAGYDALKRTSCCDTIAFIWAVKRVCGWRGSLLCAGWWRDVRTFALVCFVVCCVWWGEWAVGDKTVAPLASFLGRGGGGGVGGCPGWHTAVTQCPDTCFAFLWTGYLNFRGLFGLD